MAARAVSRKVRAAHRAHVGWVVLEGLVIAGSAAVATAAAERAAAGDPPGGQSAALLALVAALAGASWVLERLADPTEVARRLDRQEGSRGAILTAFQAESSGEDSGIARLLASQVAPGASATRFLRACARASAPLLALPFVAVALLALASEAEGARAHRLHDLDRALALAGRADAIRGRADRLGNVSAPTPELEEERRRIAEDAARLGRDLRSGATSAAESEDRVRALDHRLDRLQGSVPRQSVTGSDLEGTMESPDSAIVPDPDASMRDRPPPPRAPEPSTSAGSGERGVLASRWWPSRYDAVVDRWVASRRQSPDR